MRITQSDQDGLKVLVHFRQTESGVWVSAGWLLLVMSDLITFPMSLCCPVYDTVSHGARRAKIRRVN